MIQAEGTACAKTLRHPQFSPVRLTPSRPGHSGRDRFGEVSRGQTMEVLKDHGGRFGFYFKHDEKPVEDCEQRSKTV